MTARQAHTQRTTSETQIALTLNLDEFVRGRVQTGSPFLDHMLDLFQVHSAIALELECKGDKEIDLHHSVEDIAIVLGQALHTALGDKAGIERYGFYMVPMDEALARVCLDFSGRFAFHWGVELRNERIGNMETELFEHFFKSLAENARMNLHIDLLRGDNHHHCMEAVFKAFGRALAMAISPSRRVRGIPSSKGVL